MKRNRIMLAVLAVPVLAAAFTPECTPAERQAAKDDITIAIDMAALACGLAHTSNEPAILQTACALDEKAAEALAHGKSIAAQALDASGINADAGRE